MEFKTPELGHGFLPLALDSEPIVHIANPIGKHRSPWNANFPSSGQRGERSKPSSEPQPRFRVVGRTPVWHLRLGKKVPMPSCSPVGRSLITAMAMNALVVIQMSTHDLHVGCRFLTMTFFLSMTF